MHADHEGAETARAVRAHAYTIGSDIAFASGRYAPETAAGRRLLAHELVHTVQQRGGGGQLQRAPDDIPFEKTSDVLEGQYRARGDIRRANAIAACRTDHASCNILITQKELYALWSAAIKAKGDKEKLKTELAKPTLALLFVPKAAKTVAKKAAETVVEKTVETTTVSTGAAVVEIAVPVALLAYLVLAGINVVQIASFQAELQQKGYIVLDDPLGVCIGGCHTSPAEKSPWAPWKPMTDFPDSAPWMTPQPKKQISDDEKQAVVDWISKIPSNEKTTDKKKTPKAAPIEKLQDDIDEQPEPQRKDCEKNAADPCEPVLIDRKGGKENAKPYTKRHNRCADKLTAEKYREKDICIDGKAFDGLDDTNTLYEVKAHAWDYAKIYKDPKIGPRIVAEMADELLSELNKARKCKYNFKVVVRFESLKKLLLKVLPGLDIIVLDC